MWSEKVFEKEGLKKVELKKYQKPGNWGENQLITYFINKHSQLWPSAFKQLIISKERGTNYDHSEPIKSWVSKLKQNTLDYNYSAFCK